VKNSKIYKVAGLSLIGFAAASIGIDRANVGPIASQVAGFCGAFAGALIAQKRKRALKKAGPEASVQQPDREQVS
jgi:outer membrane lipoprotein SlyB